MTKLKIARYRVAEGTQVKLAAWPTRVEPVYRSKADYDEQLAAHIARLRSLQSKLYASNRYAVLLVFQAMDAAGKDGAIAHVMSGVNPQGCQVHSFRHPSAEELDHDFLWRTTQRLPRRGQIGIFNRSYYEEVLIVRVHPELLRAEDVPYRARRISAIWPERYRSIVDLERHLHADGTRIVKFFLHLSKEEQRRRLLDRIETPSKRWKISAADREERRCWGAYRRAYGDCLAATSTSHAPWFVIPADDKFTARLLISQVVTDLLEGLGLDYPKADAQRLKELEAMRKQLQAAG